MFKRFKQLISLGLAVALTTITMTGCTGGSDTQVKIAVNNFEASNVSSSNSYNGELTVSMILSGDVYTEVSTIQSIKLTKITYDESGVTKSITPASQTVSITHDDTGKGTGSFSFTQTLNVSSETFKIENLTLYVESNDGEYSSSAVISTIDVSYIPEYTIKPIQMQYIVDENSQILSIPLYLVDQNNLPISDQYIDWKASNQEMVLTSSGTVRTDSRGYAMVYVSINSNNDYERTTEITLSNASASSVVINVTQKPYMVDKENITLSSSNISVTYNAQTVQTVITVKDDNGNPLAGKTVKYIANITDMSSPVEGQLTTDVDGSAILVIDIFNNNTITSRDVTYTIYSSTDTKTLTISQQGKPTIYTFVSPTSLLIDGNEHQNYFIPVTILDENNDIVTSGEVKWTISSSDVVSDGVTSGSFVPGSNSGITLYIKDNPTGETRVFTVDCLYEGTLHTITITQTSNDINNVLYEVTLENPSITVSKDGDSINYLVHVSKLDGTAASNVVVQMVTDNSTFVSPISQTLTTDDSGTAIFHSDVLPNDTLYNRTAVVGFFTTSGYAIGTITQESQTPELTTLTVNSNTISVGPDAASINILAKVTDSSGTGASGITVNWAVDYDPDNYDIVSPTIGSQVTDSNGDVLINLHISENNTTNTRSANVTIYTGDSIETVSISQSGI